MRERDGIWIVRPASERERARERDASARLDDLPSPTPAPLPLFRFPMVVGAAALDAPPSPPNPVWVRQDFIFFELELSSSCLEEKKDKFARFLKNWWQN